MKTQTSSVVTLSLITGIVTTTPMVLAQLSSDARFSLPDKLPAGTSIKIDGSKSLESINKNLAAGFKKKFPDASLTTNYSSSQQGLEAVTKGTADIAAVGRILTPADTAKGVSSKLLGVEKIAIIVGEQNPFANGNITLEQFAKISRGEIRDWSKLSASQSTVKASGPIKFIDSPDSSDTRQAFARYPVFKSGVKTGNNAVKLTEESAQAVASKLGKDGIGYVPVSQIQGLTGVKVLSLNKVQPSDPKYSISQPLSFVYKKDNPSVGAKALLAFTDTPEGTAAITTAGVTLMGAATTALASPAGAISGTTTSGQAVQPNASPGIIGTTDRTGQSGISLWWLLIIPAILLGVWALFGRKGDQTTPATRPQLKPLYTDSTTSGSDTSPNVDAKDASIPLSGDLSIPTGDLSSSANGAINTLKDSSGDLLKGAGLASGAALAGGVALAGGLGKLGGDQLENLNSDLSGELPKIDVGNPLAGLQDKTSDIIPDVSLPDANLENPFDLVQEPTDNLDETTDSIPAVDLESSFDRATVTPEQVGGAAASSPFEMENPLPPIPEQAADLLAEGQEFSAAASVDDFLGLDNINDDYSDDLSLESADFATEISALNAPNPRSTLDLPSGDLSMTTPDPFDDSILSEPSTVQAENLGGLGGFAAQSLVGGEQAAEREANYGTGQITLVSPNPAQAYVHWDVPVKLKRQLRQQGGKKLAVRMYDVTDADINQPLPSNFQEFECDELAWDLHLPVPQADRQYLVEIGYVGEESRWLMLARSAPVWIRSSAN